MIADSETDTEEIIALTMGLFDIFLLNPPTKNKNIFWLNKVIPRTESALIHRPKLRAELGFKRHIKNMERPMEFSESDFLDSAVAIR